jgi:hypothetical protein
VRDQYELAFRRHNANVLVANDCRLAQQYMHNAHVHAVVVALPAVNSELEEFLHEFRDAPLNIPVFFAGSQEPSSLAHLSDQPDMILMPPTMSVESLEQLLFPLADNGAAESGLEEGSMDGETLVLHRREFSLEFRAAKAEFEREFFLHALERERGNVSRTARVVRVARRNLQLKIQTYGINLRRLRGKAEPAKQRF